MLEHIATYWLDYLLGLAAAALGFICRHFYKLYKTAQETKKTKEHEALVNEIKAITGEKDNTLLKLIYENKEKDKADSLALTEEINELRKDMLALKDGLLSLQGRQFKDQCRDLLSGYHYITTEEFSEVTNAHQAYNGLGGNHEGDALFEAVRVKYESQLSSGKTKKTEEF